MNDPFSKNNPYYKSGIITKVKRKMSMILSRASYKIKYRLPRLPKIYLSPKLLTRIIQTGISIILLFLVLGIFQLEYDWARVIQKEVRSTFSQEKDYSPQVKNYLTFGWWMNSYDRMVFMNPPENEESIPAIAGPKLSVPVSGRVIKKFGMVSSELDGKEYFHEGIDIEAPLGAPVVAVLSGTVVRVNDDSSLGRLVQINHGDGTFSLYSYCSEILVKEGQEVKQNQVIAKVGQTGKATSPMLHFELREQGQLVDPLTRIKPVSSNI